jgi:hypothetical protein
MINSAMLSSSPVFCVCRSGEAYVRRGYILSKLVPCYEGYSESNLRWAVNKRSMRKNSYVEKIRTYLRYFSVLSPLELRHLYRGVSFCMPVPKKSAACELSHVLTYSINSLFEALWFQPVLQVGKEVVVGRSEVRAIRRVVKQLPVEMLKQCSSASSCMRTRIVMEEHYTVCQHSTTFVQNGPTRFYFVFRNTKRGWADRRQTSLTQAYRNVFPDTISASIPAVATSRSSLSMYVSFVCNIFLFTCFINTSPEVT